MSKNRIKQAEFDAAFKAVLGFVQKGYTIREAIKKVNYSYITFYRRMSDHQQATLRAEKTSQAYLYLNSSLLEEYNY